ncbi:MAG: helix-turn-helix domain-containing protein, partial [Schaedlerella sp.]|nr:helix-turn-helix domain-containing protein [Schaedlerella sp.]
MAKHSFEFKKKVVLEYLNGSGGTLYLSKKYNLGSNTQLRKWINAYQTFGDEGLLRSRQQKKYTFEYKLHVVELYLSSEVSYQELALKEGIHNPALLNKWVNDFRVEGPDALKPTKKGRKKSLDSKVTNKTIAQTM